MKYLVPILILSLFLVACTASQPEVKYNLPTVPNETPNQTVQETIPEPVPEQEPKLTLMAVGDVPNKCVVDEDYANSVFNEVKTDYPNAVEFNVITCNSYTGTNEDQKAWANVHLYLISYGSSEEATGTYTQLINTRSESTIPNELKWIKGDVTLNNPTQLTLGAEAKGFLYVVKNSQAELLKVFETYSHRDNLLVYAQGVTTYKPYKDNFMATYYPTTQLLMNGFVRSTYLLI